MANCSEKREPTLFEKLFRDGKIIEKKEGESNGKKVSVSTGNQGKSKG